MQEMNEGSEVCRFLQVWLTPDRRGHTPQYGSNKYTFEDRRDKMLHILGGTGKVPAWNPAHPKQSSICLHQVSTEALHNQMQPAVSVVFTVPYT